MSEMSEAKKRLLEMIRQQRARLDPVVLEKLRAALGTETALSERERETQPSRPAQKPVKKEIKETVPYDKEAAAETIRLFLSRHDDPADFEKKLIESLKRD